MYNNLVLNPVGSDEYRFLYPPGYTQRQGECNCASQRKAHETDLFQVQGIQHMLHKADK